MMAKVSERKKRALGKSDHEGGLLKKMKYFIYPLRDTGVTSPG